MAANYGLLNNIATGLREGLVTYKTLSNMKNQQRQNDLLMQMQMKEKGLIQAQDPVTGELVLQDDPAFRQKQIQDVINEAAAKGSKLGIGAEGTLEFQGYSPEYIEGQREIFGAKRPVEYEMNKLKADMAAKGLIMETDPLTGERTFRPDPDIIKRKKIESATEEINKAAREGKILEMDAEGNLIFKSYAPGYLEGQKSLKAKPKGKGIIGPALSAEEKQFRKKAADSYA